MRAFFFAPESPRPAALMRWAVGLVFLYDAAVRWPFAVELYSADGLPMPVFPDFAFRGAGFEPIALPALWAVCLHSLLLFALLAVAVGWRTRLSLWIALSLSLYLGLLDQSGTFKKYSVIGLHLFLLLSFTRCGSVWSVDALRRLDRYRLMPLSPVWPRRLMQVLVASIYLGSAVTKIRLPDFANGELLMFSLLDDQWGGGYLGLWLSTRPKLLILASMATLLFEIAFPLLVWNRRMRRGMLALAILFHLTLAATMSLGIFSPVMLAALLAFVEEKDLRRLRRLLPVTTAKARRTEDSGDFGESPESLGFAGRQPRGFRQRVMSFVLWLSAAAIWVAAGAGIQYRLDFYNVFGSTARKELAPIDPEAATDILASLTPAQLTHYEDYFHRIEIGNRLTNGGTHTSGSESRFRTGMTVFACARLVRDHPAMRLQWRLIRPDGKEVRYAYELASASSHATVGFELTDPEQTPPGRYQLILRADGYEVARRTFDLRGE